MWIKFFVLEIGLQNARRQQLPCRDDYVRVSWGFDSNAAVLCGSYNLTRETLQWISDGNELSVQLISSARTAGRGFHAVYRFGNFLFNASKKNTYNGAFDYCLSEPVPTVFNERVILYEPSALKLYPLNYPIRRPKELRHRVTYVTRHGFNILFTGSDWLVQCDVPELSTFALAVHDFYGNKSAIDLCESSSNQQPSVKGFQYESVFHSLTLEYHYHDGNRSSPLGRIEVLQGTS